MVNEAVNFVAKRLIAEERPAGGAIDLSSQPRYGMPSNHAQFAAFTATYAVIWCFKYWRTPARWARILVAAGAVVAVVAVCASRVFLYYHTTAQVVVGFVFGDLIAVVYAAVEAHVLRPRRYTAVAASRIGRWLRLRDSSCVDDVFAVEYAAVCAASKLKKSK
jgi:dolichyldiphosphatase